VTDREKELLRRRIYLKKQLIELTQGEIKKLEEILEHEEQEVDDERDN